MTGMMGGGREGDDSVAVDDRSWSKIFCVSWPGFLACDCRKIHWWSPSQSCRCFSESALELGGRQCGGCRVPGLEEEEVGNVGSQCR